MIREFFAPRVFIIFLILWLIAWASTLVYMRSGHASRQRFIRHATAPFISGAVSLLVVIAFLAALTIFN